MVSERPLLRDCSVCVTCVVTQRFSQFSTRALRDGVGKNTVCRENLGVNDISIKVTM